MTRFEVYYFASVQADKTVTVAMFNTENEAVVFSDNHFGVWETWDGREKRLYIDEVCEYPVYECIC